MYELVTKQKVSFDKFENLEGVKVTPLENTIRDLLADNLSALGKELKLIGKEYQVNDQCRIDILIEIGRASCRERV